jgi:hypothetical protein
MKRSTYSRCALLVVTVLCATLSSCTTSNTGSSNHTTSAASGENGVLVIRRAANLGTGLFLNIWIDGEKVSAIGTGQTYKGTLPPGEHNISALLIPNKLHLSPTKMTLRVEKGQTYSFTAMWEGRDLILK